jgi:predicted naringenin-chalcone synthase
VSGPGAAGATPGVFINAVGTAAPPFTVPQEDACRILLERYGGRLKPSSRKLMKKIFEHPGIARRSFALNDVEEFFSEDPDARIRRFTAWAVDLGEQAVRDALGRCGRAPEDVTALVVNTCTGYICPGLSTYLLERLGLRRDLRAYDLVGSGCAGAVPNLQIGESLAARPADGVVVSLSVEICSATFQMGDDWGLLVSNALFGDGAAAAVLSREPSGLALVDSACRYVPEEREHIRYVHKGGQLHNQLSMQLPAYVRRAVGAVVADLLGRHGLAAADIGHWALHTGGEKIVGAIEEELGLREKDTRATREVMARYGNMSSPTVLFVLRELLEQGMRPGATCLMAAFGAGLSAQACLLRKV